MTPDDLRSRLLAVLDDYHPYNQSNFGDDYDFGRLALDRFDELVRDLKEALRPDDLPSREELERFSDAMGKRATERPGALPVNADVQEAYRKAKPERAAPTVPPMNTFTIKTTWSRGVALHTPCLKARLIKIGARVTPLRWEGDYEVVQVETTLSKADLKRLASQAGCDAIFVKEAVPTVEGDDR